MMRTFCTEYVGPDGKRYGDSVVALNWEDAQTTVDRRNRDETVIGELFAIIPATDDTDPTELLNLLSEKDDSTVH